MTSHLPADDPFSVDLLLARLNQLPDYTIGRQADNALLIANGRVSGHHALLIQCSEHVYILEDVGSKNGTFVNGNRITRKIIGVDDQLRFADSIYTVSSLLALRVDEPAQAAEVAVSEKDPLDFITEFGQLQAVFEQYPNLKKNCRNREKMIRTGSVILSSVVGIGAALSSGGTALAFLPLLSGAGLGVLVPTLCSTLLSTDEKLEVIEKEYRERYRCPNPTCRDPFHAREWDTLACQKNCRHCKAIWRI